MRHKPRHLTLISSFNKYLLSITHSRCTMRKADKALPLRSVYLNVPELLWSGDHTLRTIAVDAWASAIIILYQALPCPLIFQCTALQCFMTVVIWGKRIFWCLHGRDGDGWNEGKLFKKEKEPDLNKPNLATHRAKEISPKLLKFISV